MDAGAEEQAMANDGLEIFFASLAHALRDDGIDKAKLVADGTALGDEDISRLARIASGRWKALVSQQERQEHDLASEMLAADPVDAETAAERIGADNGIPAEFLLKARQLARGKLRRPDDPDGTTCPAGHSFSMPESMGQVLPRRPFGRNAKDHLRGFELVALVDSAPLHDAWLAKGPDSRTVILRFFEGGNGLPGLIRKARPAWDAAMDRMELSTIGPMTADKGHPRMIRPLDAAGLGDDMVALDATGIYPLENICRGRKPILDTPRQEANAKGFMSSIQSLACWLPNRPIAMSNIMAGNDGKPVLDPWTLTADRGGPGLDANAISLRWLVGGEPRRSDEAIVEDCLENHIVLPDFICQGITTIKDNELRDKFNARNRFSRIAIAFSRSIPPNELLNMDRRAEYYFRQSRIDLDNAGKEFLKRLSWKYSLGLHASEGQLRQKALSYCKERFMAGINLFNQPANMESMINNFVRAFIGTKGYWVNPEDLEALCTYCVGELRMNPNFVQFFINEQFFTNDKLGHNDIAEIRGILVNALGEPWELTPANSQVVIKIISAYLAGIGFPNLQEITLQRVADMCFPEKLGLLMTVSGFQNPNQFPPGLPSTGIEFCWVPPGTTKVGGTGNPSLGNQYAASDHVQEKGFWISKHVLTYAQVRTIVNHGRCRGEFLKDNPRAHSLLRSPTPNQRRCPVPGCAGRHCGSYWDFVELKDDCRESLAFPATCMQVSAAGKILEILNLRAKDEQGINVSKRNFRFPEGYEKGTFFWKFRLPSSSEWEYALRGGPFATNPNLDFHFQESWNVTMRNRKIYNLNNADFAEMRFVETGGGSRVLPASREGLSPNILGIVGMQGNAWELTSTTHKEGSPVVRGGDNRCPMHEAAACFEKSMKSAGFVSDFTDKSVCHGVALRLVAEET